MGMDGLSNKNAPRVEGGWHDSSKRPNGGKGDPGHLNVKHGGEQWHVERDGSHCVYEGGKLQQYPGEET